MKILKVLKNQIKNDKVNPIENDNQVREKIIQDYDGGRFVLQDGKANWNLRKNYGFNFSKIFYAIGAEEMKKARENGSLLIDEETGETFVDSLIAKNYFSKSNRMLECSLKLDFKVDEAGEKKLSNAYFCRDRLCQICMWRLSRRLSWETVQIMDRYIEENPNMIPIMISLTVKNPKMGELSKMLDVLCHGKSGAWQLLQKWLARRGIKDYIRTVEVTFNAEKQTWHPHIHVLTFVPKEYFSKENKNYISQPVLAEEWKHVCKLDYTPVVDIRRCYNKDKKNERVKFNSDMKTMSFAGAIKETAKYCVKPLDLFSYSLNDYDDDSADKPTEILNTKEVVRELCEGLHGRRLRALGGRINEISKELKFNDDEEKKDLIHSDDSGTTDAVWEEVYEYVFEDKEYYLTSRQEICQEQSESECEQLDINLESNSVEVAIKTEKIGKPDKYTSGFIGFCGEIYNNRFICDCRRYIKQRYCMYFKTERNLAAEGFDTL